MPPVEGGRGWRRHHPYGPHAAPDPAQAPGGGRRFVEPFLLLLLAEGPTHGYDLMERLSSRGFVVGEVDPGYLYRTLRGLEGMGAVTSEWDRASRGPAKRTYALTAEGERALHRWAGHLDVHRRGLDRFLGAYQARFPDAKLDAGEPPYHR